MPTPQENETRDDFISRCIPIVLDDSTAENQEQAVAVCNSMWEEAHKSEGKMNEPKERKTFSGFVTKADEEQGIIEAFFAVMGNVDQGQDVIHPGAFSKTFSERGGKVRVLDNHRTDSIMRAIGKPQLLREVGREELPQQLLAKHPDASGGAFARVKMLMDTPEGKGAFIRLRDGAVDEWSFGYDALDVDFGSVMKDGKEIPVRNLRTLKLYEISPVIFGMNEATVTVSAKEAEDPILTFASDVGRAIAQAEDDAYMKGASGATNLPIADRGRAWSASSAIRRVRAKTGSEEEPSRAYRNAFFWFDSSAPDSFGSYKLPFADVIDDKLTAIPRGVFAGAAAVQGSRGGVDIPSGDVDGVKSRMSRYYARMREQFDNDGIVPPWDKADNTEREGTTIVNNYSLKVGRAISKATAARIRAAMDTIQKQLTDLDNMLESAMGKPEPEQEEEAPDKQAAHEPEQKAGSQEAPTSKNELAIAEIQSALLDL